MITRLAGAVTHFNLAPPVSHVFTLLFSLNFVGYVHVSYILAFVVFEAFLNKYHLHSSELLLHSNSQHNKKPQAKMAVDEGMGDGHSDIHIKTRPQAKTA